MKNIKGYISREELMEAVEILANPQDKFILMAIYNGIAGKSNMSDLLGLKVEDVDFDSHTITIGDRVVNMDSDFEKITLDTIEENIYYLESDSKHTNKDVEFNPESPYVIKVRPMASNLWGIQQLKYNGFRAKFKSIKTKCDLDISPSELETSGIINELLSEKEEWTVADIQFALKIKNVSFNAFRIYSIVKEILK